MEDRCGSESSTHLVFSSFELLKVGLFILWIILPLSYCSGAVGLWLYASGFLTWMQCAKDVCDPLLLLHKELCRLHSASNCCFNVMIKPYIYIYIWLYIYIYMQFGSLF